MKKVLFVCLLTLSVCLSKPSDPPAPPAAAAPQIPQQKPAEVPPTSASHPADPTQPPASTPAASGKPPAVTDNKTTVNSTEKPKPDVHPKTGDDTTKNNGNGTANNTDKLKPTNDNVIKTTTVAPSGNNVKPTVTTKKPEGVTNATVPVSTPTSTPKPDDKDKVHPVLARGFDGSSFFGGIILTLGLLAIGFMGYKYYKNQTERNYHTL